MKPYSCSSARAFAVAICLASSFVSTASMSIPLSKTTIHVVNGMKPGSSNVVKVHCRSKDDDLGYRTISPGQEFNWQCSRNIWNTTLFQCQFWWNSKQCKIDVYNRYIDLDGKNLYFKATEEGFFVKSEKYTNWVRYHSWGYDTDKVPGYDNGITDGRRKFWKGGPILVVKVWMAVNLSQLEINGW